jgi:decaprenylphospho-beta-D-ribofuranose 2-oxidase
METTSTSTKTISASSETTASSAQDDLFQLGKDVTDWGRIKHAKVDRIAQPKSEDDLRAIVAYAQKNNLKISMRGAGHNTVGQSFIENGIMVDMMALNRIIELDENRKTLRVQCGATWEQVTRALEPKRLGVSTKQEFDIFSVGGSLAANVHGKSIDYPAMISHVLSFRILTGDGEILNVSRDEHPDLFRAAIGGWGLLGIIIDVTLQLVDDRVVEKSEVVYMKSEPLIIAYIERAKRDPGATPLCYGFLDTGFSNGFYITYRYLDDGKTYPLDELKRDEPNPVFFNTFVWLQRHCRFIRRKAFSLTWATSANPEVTLRSRRLLLWDRAPKSFNDMLLQKYYIPVKNFAGFLPKAKAILDRYQKDIKLLLLHFRYQPFNNEATLASLQDEAMCFLPVYLAEKDNPKWVAIYEQVTNELVNEVLAHEGSFYLTFIPATLEQVRRAYPHWDRFVEVKKKYDTEDRFTSLFYENIRS